MTAENICNFASCSSVGLLTFDSAPVVTGNMRTKAAEKDLSLMDVLTPRQFAVTMLVASSLTNTDIARFMGISAHTVSHHLSDIFERVGSGNRTELTVRYVHEQNRGLYGKKEFSERLAQLRKAARSTVLKTSRQRRA
jgi:DNA-binding CsgD family transcriptional regulator